jgi:hypothetical protein
MVGGNAQGRGVTSVRFKEEFKRRKNKGRLVTTESGSRLPHPVIPNFNVALIIAQIVKNFSM